MEDASVKNWIRSQIEKEDYWFHKIKLAPDLVTPGWSDAEKDKLPYFGLPKDMRGLRVLDVGCAEGFFSFEAERRGARQVVAVDPIPGSLRRLEICRQYLDSKVIGFSSSVYDIDPVTFGTFDLVFFFGLLYHLRHPLLALEKLLAVCTGTLLMQTYNLAEEDPETDKLEALRGKAVASFHPFGIKSGPNKDIDDPTVVWVPNAKCAEGMLLSAGFINVEVLSQPSPLVFRARAPVRSPGRDPDYGKAPWS